MSVSSHALFHFTSLDQLEAVKRFQFRLQGRNQENLHFVDIAELDEEDLTCEFFNCFCQPDFEKCIPELSRFIAKELPEQSFYCEDAVFTNEVDGSEIIHTISYDGAGGLKIDTDWVENGFYDVCIEAEDCAGKSFVITGKLKYFENRDEFVEYIEELGGKVVGSVSSKTDYLICNDTGCTSSKMKKAKELGVGIITEEEFIRRFGDPYDFDLDVGDERDDEDD